MLALPLVLFTEPLDVFLPHGRPAEQAAREGLGELERRHVPLLFASRGTRMEVEFVRRRLGNQHPFITENGGGLFVPDGYFRQRIPEATSVRHYHCVSFAKPYAEACAALEEIAAEANAEVVGFHQMSAREVAENAGLPLRIAGLARQREYDEPFFFAGEEAAASRRLEEVAKARGWRVVRGESFWHISSGTEVGRAMRRLLELYRAARHGRVRSVAVGSSRCELDMLTAAGRAILLPVSGGAFDEVLMGRLPTGRRAASAGATGWNEAVVELLG